MVRIKTIVLIYLLCSFTEWFLHSQIMHGNPKTLAKVPIIGKALQQTATGHLNHHKDVAMDMSLISNELYKGLYFNWETTVHITTAVFIFGLPIKHYLSKNTKQYIYVVLAIGIVYSILWNNLHLDMHKNTNNIPLHKGVPNVPKSLSKGPIYNYLYKYHAIHHLQKGVKKNFNIVLPGFDLLFGTHQGFWYDNSSYCKTTLDNRCFASIKGELND